MKEDTGRPTNEILMVRNYHDLEKRSVHLFQLINDANLNETTRQKLYWLDGIIDGGDMGGCSPAMDYLDPTAIDGGAM